MMKLRIFCFILMSIFFVSCPCNIPEWILVNGQEIQNFPDWTTCCNAFSSWMDWQSEDGKRLHDLVDDSIISDEYEGRFRIGLCGQNITIGFNNQKGTAVKLYNWYGSVSSWDDSAVLVEQEDIENQFVYECYCKKQKSEEATKENQSKVVITKIDEKTFNYKQTISGKVVIDCEFKNLAYYCVDLEENRHTKPIDIPIKLCEYFPIEYLDEEESILYFYPVDGSSSYKKIAFFPNNLFRYIYCPEGFSFKEINEEKNAISFNLLDSKESDYIDFIEIQVNSKADVSISFYKIIENNPILVNELTKSDLTFEWLDSETGEIKTYKTK